MAEWLCLPPEPPDRASLAYFSSLAHFLCKECACLCRKRGVPTLADGLIGRMASSTVSNTSAAAKLAAAAAHPLDPVTVRTGTPSTGTIASAPGAFTSASPCHAASNSSMPRLHPRHTPRRTRRQITRRELFIRSARTGDRLRKGRRALARLGQPFGLPTFPQTYDALASLAVYHSDRSFPSVRRWLRCTSLL